MWQSILSIFYGQKYHIMMNAYSISLFLKHTTQDTILWYVCFGAQWCVRNGRTCTSSWEHNENAKETMNEMMGLESKKRKEWNWHKYVSCITCEMLEIRYMFVCELLVPYTKWMCVWAGAFMRMREKYLMNFLLKFLSFRSISQGKRLCFSTLVFLLFYFFNSFFPTYFPLLLAAMWVCFSIVSVYLFLSRFHVSHIYVENVWKISPKLLTFGIINPV